MIDRERLKDHIVQLTRDLVLIESTDARPEERRRCFQLIRNHLEEVPGIELRRLENHGYESLVVLPEGCEMPKVLFCGHLDVVEHPDPESYRSEIRDGRIYGPGAGDMKGQLAILVHVVRHLWREHPGLPVGLAITSDEERGGEQGVRFLVEEAGVSADIAVIPDGGSLNDVIVEEKGILHLSLSAEGVAAHAARPWLGDNALERLMRATQAIQREIFEPHRPAQVDPDDLDTHWFPTCSVTMIETANDSPNRIPESAEAVLDVRFPPPHTVESMLGAIRDCLEAGVTAAPIVSAEPTHLAPDASFVALTEEVTGQPARLVRASGGSDARFFFGKGIPVMLSRPRVGNLHGRDEWIDIASMLDYFEICRLYALERALV
ncbi:MAG: M20 family metallopeptidase [Verrucomicrobiae bacterium]|nr:M20 family metallopeptidase [Verrucomicrobiae bacterium]